VRCLMVMEVTEMFMLAQSLPLNRGWWGMYGNEGFRGEALSRFLGEQFLMGNGLGFIDPRFQSANQWMNSPRADYVNAIDHSDDDNTSGIMTGCAILFINYLHSQLGFSVKEIVAAAEPELAGVYKKLTGLTHDPYPQFKSLLDLFFPGTSTIPGPNPENPFPLRLTVPHRYEIGTWVSWSVKVDVGGPTGHGPVPPWTPFIRQLAAGFTLAEAAALVSPELRESVNKLAAEQIQLASRQIADRMVTPSRSPGKPEAD
jgi:hypothetical protein